MVDLLNMANEERSSLFDLLKRLVEVESPSDDKVGNDRLGALLASELEALGADIVFVPQPEYGDHLLARWPGRSKQGLVIGHRDTVWPLGTLARFGYEHRNGRVYGPGVLDMKGGLAAAIAGLQLLRESGRWPSRPLTFLINADEEKGSVTSRPVIEKEAGNAEYVIVMEPGQGPTGSIPTRRKGVGEYHIFIEGTACHASLVADQGVSAIREMGLIISYIYSIADYEKGTTVNVGLVNGGTARNTVAARAHCVVDVRVPTKKEADRIESEMQGLNPSVDGASIRVTGGLHRPPMERTPAISSLVERIHALANDLGIELLEVNAAGGSDANLTAAIGAATVDGMGAIGGNAHAEGEYIVAEDLVRRAALFAHVVASL